MPRLGNPDHFSTSSAAGNGSVRSQVNNANASAAMMMRKDSTSGKSSTDNNLLVQIETGTPFSDLHPGVNP